MGHGLSLALGVSEDVSEHSGVLVGLHGHSDAHQVLVGFRDTALAIRIEVDLLGLSPAMVLFTSSRAGGEEGPQKALWNQGESSRGTHRALTLKFLPNQRCFRALFLPRAGTSVSKSASKPERSAGRNWR